MRLLRMGQLAFMLSIVMIGHLIMPASCIAGESFVAAVGGNFFYTEGSNGNTPSEFSNTLNNRVQATTWHGIPAWQITWDDPRIRADHYIRMSDGAPLYVKRVNHALHRSVEIQYGLDANHPSIYRRRSENEYVERKIWNTDLRDLGALPQLLVSRQNSPDAKKITFSAINYDDGQVYDLIAKRKGVYHMNVLGRKIHCASYTVNIDSWMARFNKSIHIVVPMQADNANFFIYNGPDLAGTGKDVSLRLVSKAQSLALLSNHDVMKPSDKN